MRAVPVLGLVLVLGLEGCGGDGGGRGGQGKGPGTGDGGGGTGTGTMDGSTSAGSTGGGSTGIRVAPDGYWVDGATIRHANGSVKIFRGVSRPSLEWSPIGEHLSAVDFQRIASWNARVVRLPLNQDYWLAGAALHDPAYPSAVAQAVSWARAAGLDVILDLHWSDRGDLSNPTPGQQRMPDANSVTFWREVAARWKDDGRVIFELYNEPHDVPWTVWRDGGPSGDGFTAAGMQQLYDAVRSVGAENLVLVGGLDWGYDLSGVPAHRLRGYNIAYATHPYELPGKEPATWLAKWGFLTATDPVVLTELGSFDCSTAYTAQLVDYAESVGASWVGWAWYPGGCSFPSMILDWKGLPSAPGWVVRNALESH